MAGSISTKAGASSTRRSVILGSLASGLLAPCLATRPVFAQPVGARSFPLRSPEGLTTNLVRVAASRFKESEAVAVALTEDAQKALLAPGSAGCAFQRSWASVPRDRGRVFQSIVGSRSMSVGMCFGRRFQKVRGA